MRDEDLPRFNPRPVLQAVAIGDGQQALVVDDVLLNPEALVDLAARHPQALQRPRGYAFPGREWWMPPDFASRLDDFFRQHVRGRLGGRRTVDMSCRLSMVNFAPQELAPHQWQCHRDLQGLQPGRIILASVLYLFQDPALGGTSFFRPRRSHDETVAMLQDALRLDGPAFTRARSVQPGYIQGSNAWFEHTATLPARFNRMVFYNGTVFHAGDIQHPERLGSDARTGRLTLNGFFACTPQAS
ncbi:MAG: hypothetical protein CFE45_18875 [Burkholderiales bacterium PBB5]|nr:MAG: hypothetical protein CFE45_18875 [Burkholderiales bacterium PBB5]